MSYQAAFSYGEELLAPRPNTKLRKHPLSAVRDCLFNIFAAILHDWKLSPPSATREYFYILTNRNTVTVGIFHNIPCILEGSLYVY